MKIEILEASARAIAAGVLLGAVIGGCSGCAQVRALEQRDAAERILEADYSKAIAERNFYEKLADRAHALLAATQRKNRDDVVAAYARGRGDGHRDVRCTAAWPALDVEPGARAGEILVRPIAPALSGERVPPSRKSSEMAK